MTVSDCHGVLVRINCSIMPIRQQPPLLVTIVNRASSTVLQEPCYQGPGEAQKQLIRAAHEAHAT